jgi:transposase-like protein
MANENGPGSWDADRSNLLSPDERNACRRVAAGTAPHSQRALALMALDQGVTQSEAGELSGLSQGQVRYWRDRFREKRLSIFPEDIRTGAEKPSPRESQPQDTRDLEDDETLRSVSRSQEKKGSKKKAKAGKKKKKSGKKIKTSKKGKGAKAKKKKAKKNKPKRGKKGKAKKGKGKKKKSKKGKKGKAKKKNAKKKKSKRDKGAKAKEK